jgi:repressor LexA
MPPKKSPLPLSAKELQVMQFLESFIQTQGIAPSYKEICEHFGFASFNSVQRYLKQLQDKNYIESPGGSQKRALRVLHSARALSSFLESQQASDVTNNLSTASQRPKKKGTPWGPPSAESLSVSSLAIPLLGRVAAGTPIEAFHHNETLDVPSSMVPYPGKTYALIVQGDSMIDDGIWDGDRLLVQRQTYAQNGDTVIAVIDQQATVKRFYLHTDIHKNPQSDAQGSVELRPANQRLQSMWFDPKHVEIQGVVIGLLRRL